MKTVLQRSPSVIEPRGVRRRGSLYQAFLEIGRAFIARKRGKRGAIASLFASPKLPTFICFQLPSNVIVYHFVRRGSIIITPAVRKSAFKSFDHLLTQPPQENDKGWHCLTLLLAMPSTGLAIRHEQPCNYGCQ